MLRLRRLALAVLALVCVFVIAAGAVLAGLLPDRLARWDVTRVADRPLAAVRPPLAAVGPGAGVSRPVPSATASSPAGAPTRASDSDSSSGGLGGLGGLGGAGGAGGLGSAPTTAGLAATLAPLLRTAALGPHVGMLVTSLDTGQVLYARHAGARFAPASTTKVATAVAALHVLGPDTRFATTVVTGRGAAIVLVGGGDPTLAAGAPPATDYPQPATLAQLAAKTARELRRRGRHMVRLDYDTTLFTGSGMAPGWPNSYVTTGNVTPITSLEADQGRLTTSGAPEDADDPGNTRPRTFTPAADAATAFAQFLTDDGIRVRGTPTQAAAPAGASLLGRVWSPTLAQMVRQMLLESNNVIAENLARHVALAAHAPASFRGAATAEMATLTRLGVHGVRLVDGSGLSPRDRITPAALVALIRLASGPARSGLRAAITGLPVAGFSGTLAPGGSVFAEAGPAALGVVRAKTGNLNTVAALAGIAYARDGQLLSFAVMADHVRAPALDQAGETVADLATALAGCGCRA